MGSTIPSKPTTKDLVVYKTITIKNTGKEEWPKNCFLTNVSENKSITSQDSKLMNIAPGKEMSAVLIIDNPRIAGDLPARMRVATFNSWASHLTLASRLLMLMNPNLRLRAPRRRNIPRKL